MESTTPRGTRTGFTTGACAAAAARAAAQGLETGQVPDAMESLLPNGQRVRFDVHDRRCDAHSAHAMVVKFAGDDPDCTDGAHLTVDLRLLPGKAGEIAFVAGDGVGTVTLPGLGLAIEILVDHSQTVVATQAVAVTHSPFVHIANSFNAAMRMHRETGNVVIRIIAIEGIEHQNRVVFRRRPIA